jgi:hypothetical protein
MGENKKTVMESAVQALNSRGVLFSGSLYLYTEFLFFTFYFLLFTFFDLLNSCSEVF